VVESGHERELAALSWFLTDLETGRTIVPVNSTSRVAHELLNADGVWKSLRGDRGDAPSGPVRLARTSAGTGPSRIALVESGSRAVTPDALFDALDGRCLWVAGGTWQLEVYSVHDEQGSRWIQAALKGDRLLPVTIKLTAEVSIEDALSRVAARLAEGAEGDAAIDVSSDPVVRSRAEPRRIGFALPDLGWSSDDGFRLVPRRAEKRLLPG
jgi:hypothetical protein